MRISDLKNKWKLQRPPRSNIYATKAPHPVRLLRGGTRRIRLQRATKRFREFIIDSVREWKRIDKAGETGEPFGWLRCSLPFPDVCRRFAFVSRQQHDALPNVHSHARASSKYIYRGRQNTFTMAFRDSLRGILVAPKIERSPRDSFWLAFRCE